MRGTDSGMWDTDMTRSLGVTYLTRIGTNLAYREVGPDAMRSRRRDELRAGPAPL